MSRSFRKSEPILFRMFLVATMLIVASVLTGSQWFMVSAFCAMGWGCIQRHRQMNRQERIESLRVDMRLRDQRWVDYYAAVLEAKPETKPPHIHLPEPVRRLWDPETNERPGPVVAHICLDCKEQCEAGQQTEDGKYYVVRNGVTWIRQEDGEATKVEPDVDVEDTSWMEAYPDFNEYGEGQPGDPKKRDAKRAAAEKFYDDLLSSQHLVPIIMGDHNVREMGGQSHFLTDNAHTPVRAQFASDHGRWSEPQCSNCGDLMRTHQSGVCNNEWLMDDGEYGQ